MSTVYIPQTIESAEQAEALDAGTLLIHDRYAPLFVAEDEDGKTLNLRRGSPSYMDVRNAVGWTALVPIEAEEETRIDPEVFNELDARLAYTQAAYALPPGELQMRHQTRHTTPWEAQD